MGRGEIYVQLAVNFPRDAKVIALARFGRDARPARDLYVCMALYCKENLTDGFVPDEVVGQLVYPDLPRAGAKQAQMLVEVGLIERTDGGWHVPAYLKRNKAKAEVDELSAKRSEIGRTGGRRSGMVRRSQPNAKQLASPDEANTNQDAPCGLNTEVIGHRSQSKPSAPAQPTRQRDELFEAVIAACGINSTEITQSQRGSLNGALKQLRDVKADADQVPARAAVFTRKWPGVSLTPPALAKHWAACDPGLRPTGTAPSFWSEK